MTKKRRRSGGGEDVDIGYIPSLPIVKIGVNFGSSIMKNEKNAPYIGGQWEECSLHWWSVGRMSLTLVVSEKNVPYICGH